MTPAERTMFDGAVAECLAEGMSQRQIAAELGCDRDRVRRAIGRLQRSAKVTALAKVDAPNVPADDGASPIADLLAGLETEIEKSMVVGDSVSAGRWARTRAALLAGQREAARIRANAPAVETTEDWTRLNDRQVAMLAALTRRLNGEAPTTSDEKALRVLDDPRPPEPACVLCHHDHGPRCWLCEVCADQVHRLRAGLPIANPGEQVIGVLPAPSP